MSIRRFGLARFILLLACVSTIATAQEVRFGTPASEHRNRGVERYTKKDLDKAIAEFNEAIRLDPSSSTSYCCRALALHDKEEFEKAVADYTEAIRLDPKDFRALNNRGNSLSAIREFDKALADYDAAVGLEPNFAAAYRNRARVLASCPDEQLRDGKLAVESATRGCELVEWNDPTYLDTLACALAQAGDFDAAAAMQARAIELVRGFEDRLKLYREKQPLRVADGADLRLSQSRFWVSPAAKPRPYFVVPYDATLYLSPAGGSAGATTEFGLGTSEADHKPIFTGLPGNPEPNREVKVGLVKAGTELHFYEKTEWGGIRWAFSHDSDSEGARVAFHDRDNDLGLGGSVIEKTGPETWIFHLDDAGSVDIDDNNADVLIEMRLVPTKQPGKDEKPAAD